MRTRDHHPATGRRIGRFVLLSMLATQVLGGCGRRSSPADPSPVPAEPDRILRQMIDAYAQASSYADRGVVRLRYRVDGQWRQDEGRLAIRFERPNRLLARVYQSTLASDGRRWQVAIADAPTRDMDGQVVVRPSPERLTLETIYDDPLVLSVMAGGMGGPPVALELLLSDRPLEHLFSDQARRELLEDAVVEGRACRRVRADLPEGPLVLWIDRETFVLRRLEFPTAQLAAQLDPEGRLEGLSLVAEMRNADLNIDLSSDTFGFDLPDDAKIVRRFVLPPQRLPTRLYGRLPADFHFTDLQGRRVSRQSLLGRPAVLAWFNIHAASEACLVELSLVQEEFSGAADAVFFAVCTEPTTVSNRQLQQLAEHWGLSLPLVRDLEAFGRDVFQIPGAPTVVVLDARGVVQAFEVGASPALADTITAVLRAVSDGGDPAAQRVAQAEQQRQQYEQVLAEVLQPLSHGAVPREGAWR